MTKSIWSEYSGIISAAGLVPLVFVVHHIQRFFPFLGLADVFWTLAKYFGLGMIFWLFSFLLLKEKGKASLYTIYLQVLYFFFQPVHESLINNFDNYFFARYIFIIPFLFVVSTLIYLTIKRISFLPAGFAKYPQIVFAIFILLDLATMVKKSLFPGKGASVILASPHLTLPQPNPSQEYPDIFLLIYDELGSSQSIHKRYGYDNSGLDSHLLKRGFLVLPGSKSNYYWTQFSLASMLNLDYLTINRPGSLGFDDYVAAMNLIRNNRLTALLSGNGYTINNYSPFELYGAPAKTQYTANNFGILEMDKATFWPALNKDIGWNFRNAGSPQTDTMPLHKDFLFAIQNQEKATAGVLLALRDTAKRPQFTYGHFFYSHAPFVYDSTGQVRPAKEAMADGHESNYVRAYLNTLPVVKERIIDLVSQIMQAGRRELVIIVMGDHGFRPKPDKFADSAYFENFMAVYVPPKYKLHFSKSTTTVNQFRQLTNAVFNSRLPVLPDTLIYLHDK